MIDYEQLGRFYLGREVGPSGSGGGAPGDSTPILYEARDLTTHAVCVGMTGSGKTGLCIGLLEEAALDGIPAVAIDPKGDLGDLALTFPELRPSDFRPWIDEAEAARQGIEPDALAARVARRWRDGLAAWGQSPERIRRLREAAEVRIYTPGSSAGRPLAALRSLAPPHDAAAMPPEARRERISSLVSGLLSLLGIEADPIRDREHILLSTLVGRAWEAGAAVDLGSLVGLVQRPPIERVGVIDLDSFYPPADRMDLALRLNALLASPSFAEWLRGDPLDAASLLHGPDGRPRVSVISIAHLGDRERMFVVTLVLSEMLAWMRRQPGSTSLRAILYLDEVLGFLPPVAAPPSKAPLLTMLKQARAYGLGVVLATQNPVDVDYKALGNAGTWLVGRLQTARDRDRLLDGMAGAGGAGLDRGDLRELLAGLESRRFLLHDVHEDGPVLMKSRWALSYLRGPLTLAEIRRLATAGGAAASPCSGDERATAGGRSTATPAAPEEGSIASGPRARSALPAAGAASRRPLGGPRPPLEPGVDEVFLAPEAAPAPATHADGTNDPPAPAGLVTAGADAGDVRRYEPALLALASLHFVRVSVGLDAWRRERALVPLSRDGAPRWESLHPCDHALEDGPRAGWSFAPLPGKAARARSYRTWSRAAVAHLYRTRRERLWTCRRPKAASRSGESEAEFRARLAAIARADRDERIERLRRRYAPRLARARERIQRASERVERETAQYAHQRAQTAISLGASLLGALFGRKLGSLTSIRSAGAAARAASRATRERGDIARAQKRLESERARLAALDRQLAEALAELRTAIDPRQFELEPLDVPPRKSDIRIERLALAWMPSGGGNGRRREDAAEPAPR